jgi:hypothetical protein
MDMKEIFPAPPIISDEQIKNCRASGDYCPIMFEWYKYVGLIANLIASIERTSRAAREIPSPQYGALIGLLNRCSRLMLANVALSHNGLFGETTAILDRCIFESTVKVLWLCNQNSDDAFRRFFAEGLKTELELKSEIQEKIAKRGGKTLVIEERMLASIERYLATSGLSDREVSASKKLPNLASMIQDLGHNRLAYVVGQKIGSHHVHGTWPSLLLHYLDWDTEGSFRPRDHDCSTHINQYIFVPLMVLWALKEFCSFIVKDSADAQPFLDFLQSIEDKILQINQEIIGGDFEVLDKT